MRIVPDAQNGVRAEPANANIQAHIGVTSGNPHGVTVEQTGHATVTQTSIPTMETGGTWSNAAAPVASLPSKNLHDPTVVTNYALPGCLDAYILNNTTGLPNPFANGMCTNFISMTPGCYYTIWLPATVNGFTTPQLNLPHVYRSDGTHIGLEQGVYGPMGLRLVRWTSGDSYKIMTFQVTNATIAKIRISMQYTTHTNQQFIDTMNSIQCECSSYPTAFQAYGTARSLYFADPSTVATVMADAATALTVTARSTKTKIISTLGTYYIRTPWSDTHDLVQRVIGTDFQGAYLHTIATTDATIMSAYTTGTKLGAQGDEHCPLWINGTYVGGGHGPAYGMQITATAHGKTTAGDLGSVWNDGVRNWTIIAVPDANTLMLLSDNTGTGSKWTFATSINGTSLTYVSNATHTGNITFSASSGSQQLLPYRKSLTTTLYVDNEPITVDGIYSGMTVDIRHTYDIPDLAALLTYYKALTGTSRSASYIDSGIAADLRVSTTYRYSRNGSCNVLSSLYAYQDVTFVYNGFIQLNPPEWTGNKLYSYVPRMTSWTEDSRTWDFSAIADISTQGGISSWQMTPARWADANNPPDRIALLAKTAGGTAISTFTAGYSPIRAIGVPATRKTLIGNLALETVGSSRKTYFHGIDYQGTAFTGSTLPAGALYEVSAYRNWVNPATVATATVATWFRDGTDYVWILDFHQSVTALTIAVPNEHVGRTINVVDKSANMTVLNSIVEGDGFAVTVTGGYGYAVIRL